MKYEEWYKLIKQHLSNYKIDTFGNIGDGVYAGNGRKYSHILPDGFKEENYMCKEAKEALQDKRHPDWYHLNSSQTLCVNFFSKIKEIDNKKYLNRFLSKIIGKDIIIKESCFEYKPVEKSSEFDFYIKDINNHNYYFEIKYTEKGIAAKGGGKTAHETYKKLYLPDVINNPYFKNVSEDDFLNKHFQAYRNMVKGVGNDYSVLIMIWKRPKKIWALKKMIM